MDQLEELERMIDRYQKRVEKAFHSEKAKPPSGVYEDEYHRLIGKKMAIMYVKESIKLLKGTNNQ